ncbi:MAG: hypothetical protein U0840_16500 [Gemmataceae bacterium]
MNTLWIAGVAFGATFGGFFLGLILQRVIPDHHTSGESRDTMKMGLGLIATLTALVLGLLVATTKGSYDSQASAIRELASTISLMDRILVRYGPEASDCRVLLRQGTSQLLDQMWPEESANPAQVGSPGPRRSGEALFDMLSELKPTTEAQKLLRSRALDLTVSLGQIRQKLISQQESAIPTAFLVVLISWLSILFACYGLLTPWNLTVLIVHLVCMISVASAVFLVLELDRPFQGIIRVPNAPLKSAFERLSE